MRAHKVQFAAGCYYHLYNRGAHRYSIFLGDPDYQDFLARLRKYAAAHATTLLAYCLMPNHFHLLVRQEGEDCPGRVVQLACNGYAQAFNCRHGHSGALFQGRYQRILVDRDEYLRHLCRYIHANPVKDGFALRAELWPYSNYADWIGARRVVAPDRPGQERVDRQAAAERQFVAEFFGTPAAYGEYVASWVERKHMPDLLHAYLAALEQGE